MRRFLSLFLAFLLVFSLCACGGPSDLVGEYIEEPVVDEDVGVEAPVSADEPSGVDVLSLEESSFTKGLASLSGVSFNLLDASSIDWAFITELVNCAVNGYSDEDVMSKSFFMHREIWDANEGSAGYGHSHGIYPVGIAACNLREYEEEFFVRVRDWQGEVISVQLSDVFVNAAKGLTSEQKQRREEVYQALLQAFVGSSVYADYASFVEANGETNLFRVDTDLCGRKWHIEVTADTRTLRMYRLDAESVADRREAVAVEYASARESMFADLNWSMHGLGEFWGSRLSPSLLMCTQARCYEVFSGLGYSEGNSSLRADVNRVTKTYIGDSVNYSLSYKTELLTSQGGRIYTTLDGVGEMPSGGSTVCGFSFTVNAAGNPTDIRLLQNVDFGALLTSRKVSGSELDVAEKYRTASIDVMEAFGEALGMEFLEDSVVKLREFEITEDMFSSFSGVQLAVGNQVDVSEYISAAKRFGIVADSSTNFGRITFGNDNLGYGGFCQLSLEDGWASSEGCYPDRYVAGDVLVPSVILCYVV